MTPKQAAQYVRTSLEAIGDPERAAQQQAYMKSAIPFAGVAAPELRKLVRATFSQAPPSDQAHWLATADEIWRNAIYREERHASIELLAIPRFQKAWLDPSCLPQIRYMIESGAWWDFVDALATNHLGKLLRQFESETKPELETWINDPDLWIRRSSILVQLKYKADTDLNFLDRAIQGSIDDADFFARKAIGWALRELSKTNPSWVIQYAKKHSDQLSPLSKREGLRILKKQGLID